MQVLDLRPPSVTIKFTKGSTLNPIFFYLGDKYSVIDLTGYKAHFQARNTATAASVISGFNLTTENGGLAIVTAIADTPKGPITAQGVQLNVSSLVTSGITFRTAVFGIEVTSPSGIVTTLVTGVLEPYVEPVR